MFQRTLVSSTCLHSWPDLPAPLLPFAFHQVAELIAACVESPELAENKCLEVRNMYGSAHHFRVPE